MEKTDGDIQEALKKSFIETDKEVTTDAKANDDRSGTTAITAVVVNREKAKKLYTANVGDARMVLCRGGQAERLTVDHKASDEEEGKRITEKGGWITGGRIACMLAVSRAFGDYELKDWIIAEPYCREIELTADDTHLILACDGLWDVADDQEAVDLIKDETDMAVASEKLVKYALDHGTKDNVSVIVVAL